MRAWATPAHHFRQLDDCISPRRRYPSGVEAFSSPPVARLPLRPTGRPTDARLHGGSAVRFAVCLFVSLAALAAPARADDKGVEFFEKKVRPVLVEHCY